MKLIKKAGVTNQPCPWLDREWLETIWDIPVSGALSRVGGKACACTFSRDGGRTDVEQQISTAGACDLKHFDYLARVYPVQSSGEITPRSVHRHARLPRSAVLSRFDMAFGRTKVFGAA